jgi:hypothetical protein
MSPSQIVILETSGADSSVLTGAVTETQAATMVRPFGTASRCVYGVLDLCSSSVRGGVGCEATPHRRAAQTEFLNIAPSEIKFVQVLASRTMNHVKQRVAKDMSAASELVRA